MNGTVFDIRRFSTHDGDGIRTTVFFKGCPLSCVWCQNPEGISRKRRPLYFANRCIGCQTCINSSKNGGFYKKDGNIMLDHLAKEDWDVLIDRCPTGAIEMDSQVFSPEALMKEIRKDLVFFHHGGGVTLSGGEPLLQWEFAKEILKRCKEEGIHTAIETALSVPQKILEEISPYADLVFADLKLMDEQKHKRYVGTSNIQIKDNIKWLLTSKRKDRVIIRTPMIPGLTAEKQNIEGIARFISGIYPEVSYEILNYNPLAKAKYHLVGREYWFRENPSKYSSEKMEEFGNWARLSGVKNIIIES